MLGTAISFLKANKGVVAAASAVIALGISAMQLYNYVYDTGYKAAETAMLADYNRKMAAASEQFKADVKAALDTAAADHKAELDRAMAGQKVVTKTETVIEYVTKYIKVPATCDQLASDIVRVLDDAADIVYTATDYGSAAAADTGGFAGVLPQGADTSGVAARPTAENACRSAPDLRNVLSDAKGVSGCSSQTQLNGAGLRF